MYKYLILLALLVLFADNSMAFTFSRHARVSIVDRNSFGGIHPVTPHANQASQGHDDGQKQSGHKAVFLSKILKRTDQASEQSITGEYVLSGSKTSNIQVALKELHQPGPMKFKSMRVTQKPGKESIFKLAAVVAIPGGTSGGRYNPALQISAHYE